MNLERLTRGHVVAAVSALALLLVMAMDWYGSVEADEARRITSGPTSSSAQGGEAGRAVEDDAQRIIARDEKNAWQTSATIDRVLLAFLLLSVFVPLMAAGFRAQGRRFEPPWTPSAFAALVASVAALLLAYRILQEPGDDVTTTIKIGTLLALLLLAAVGLGAVSAYQRETEWTAMRRAAGEPVGAAGDPGGAAGDPGDAPGKPRASDG